MLFSPKTKGYFIEQTEQAWFMARTSAVGVPCVLEEFKEVPLNDADALAAALKEIQPKKSPSGYVHATCAVYPPKRLVRRASLELKRVKEPGYLAEVCTQQFRVEAEKYTLAVLNSADGSDYEISKAAGKEVLFCGLPGEDIVTIQNALLESGIYPERLELGSVSLLGGVVDYLEFSKSKVPTLVLELGGDTTYSYIVSTGGVDASRPIPQGIEAMIPVVQKELGLKDEESAKKLFYSNTFDFTGMGPQLIKRLLKELQSSIGFYEVQTGQSIGQVVCTLLPPKLGWLENSIATALGVAAMKFDFNPWLQARQIGVSDHAAGAGLDRRWFGLLALIARYNLPEVAHAAAAEKKD
jgi:Tfp pilus assembly PilM family ATPase